MNKKILDLRLAPPVLSAWLGALVLPSMPLQWIPVISVLALVLSAGFLIAVYKGRLATVGLVSALAVGALGGVGVSLTQSARTLAADPLARAWQGNIAVIKVIAQVETPPRKYAPDSDQQIVQLKLQKAQISGSAPVNTGLKIMAFASDLPVYPRGTILQTAIKLEKSPSNVNPAIENNGGINANNLFEIRGKLLSTPKVRAGPGGAAALKQKFTTWLEEKLAAVKSPAAATLLPAMILGIRADASENTEALKTAGIVHITCVSGMHISVLISLVALLSAGFARQWRLLICGTLLVGYCLLLGPSPSLLRASVMGMVSILALAAGREPCSFSSLAAAIIGLLIFNPAFGSDIGFLLSVSSTAAIVLAVPFIARKVQNLTTLWGSRFPRPSLKITAGKYRDYLKKGFQSLLSVGLVSLVAQLACLPGQLLIRPGINTLSVLANVAIAPVVTLLIWGGAILVFLPLPGYLLARILAFGCEWVMVVARAISANRFAILPWPQGIPGLLALGALVTGIVFIWRCYFPKRGKRWQC